MNTTATAPLTLHCAGRPVARYEVRADLGRRSAPRPFLHPVTTLAGTPVTEYAPADHPHHLGAGVAVPDVDGHNFWGGRTYVRGQGPTALDNHGEQRHRAFEPRCPDGRVEDLDRIVEDLDWIVGDLDRNAEARLLLRERRTVAVTRLADDAWALDLTFALTNPGREPVIVGSPATNGRPGAGYGGFFWRAPKESAVPSVRTPDAEGEEAVHGRPADWLALTGDGWTLVFAGATAETRRDPWFVRTAEYPGVGSSLAARERLPIAPGDTVVRRIVTVVADGRPDRERTVALVGKAVSA
ncbi:PmoA family protein [Streptomyces sp. HUAS MG91]|uniref:PmoA family protein n=1 Tax=Streptomyces tabacisoli TaxID=3156398 RepID=A0AAU8IQE5_9ACTN